MKMKPAKKLILGLAAVCIALSLITMNNAVTVAIIYSAQHPGTAVSGNGQTSNGGTANGGNNGTVIDNNGGNAVVDNGSTSQDPATPGTSDNAGTPSSGTNPSGGNASTPSTPSTPSGGSAAKPSSGAPTTTAQIVDYYKTALNKARTSAKSATLIYDGALNYRGVFEAGKLSSLKDTVVTPNMKASEKNDAKAPSELPPGKGVQCNLTANDVDKATCVDKGTYYEISIIMKDEVNPAPGKGMGTVVGLITQDQITGGVSKVPGVSLSNIKLEYFGARKATQAQQDGNIVCQVEKATGNMTLLKVDAPCVLHLDAKVPLLGSMTDVQVGIECVSNYKITF